MMKPRSTKTRSTDRPRLATPVGTRRHGRWAVVAAIAVFAAGCGGGDGSSSPSTTEPIPTSSQTTVAGDGIEVDSESTDDSSPDVQEPRYVDGDADVIFTQDQLNTFELTLDPDQLAFLDGDPTAEEYVEGTLTFDGETIEGVGIRYKGSVGSWIACLDNPNPFAFTGGKKCTKLSMKVKINYTDDDAEFYGQRKLNLHAQNNDPTLMHERLGYWLYGQMGVAAPRSTHVRLVVNGEFVGVFGLTEEVDGRFTRANFDDGKGNLYKEVWPTDDSGAPATGEDLLAGLETNEDENPSVELISTFAQEIVAAGPEGAPAVLERWMDVERIVAQSVVDRTIRHDDGPYHWYCSENTGCAPHNFYWYEDPTERTVHLIPWDLDLAFVNIVDDYDPSDPKFEDWQRVTLVADGWGETSNGCQPFKFENNLQRSAACDPVVAAIASFDDDYERLRTDFVAGPFSAETVDAQLDAWTTQIADAVAEADAAHDDALTVEQWNSALTSLRDELDVARAG